MRVFGLTAAIMLTVVGAAAAPADFNETIQPFLQANCVQCHGPALSLRDLRLDQLHAPGAEPAERDIWTRVLNQLSLGAMPPKPLPRPDDGRLGQVKAALRSGLGLEGSIDAAERAGFGNYVDHEALFSGAAYPPAPAPARVWRINAHAFKEMVNTLAHKPLLVAKPNQGGDGLHPSLPSLTPEHTFRDFANVHSFEDATTELLMNMLWLVAGYQMDSPGSPAPLRAPLALEKPGPADYEAAVEAQYREVLQRDPTPEELQGVTGLALRTAADAGPRLALQTALSAVLLTPEAVFRFELGRPIEGDDDAVRLSDREIAWALSYALTDRPPDEALREAEEAGKLSTREGVLAEARRMLDDPGLDKPRILRFFREYFEYDRAPNVFKTGRLIKHIMAREMVLDADALVAHTLESDQDVLRTLLTTSKYFVNYNSKNPEKQLVNRPDKRQKWYYELYNLDREWEWTPEQPVQMPAGQRSGMLTHPAWLLTFSDADKNQAIQRGRWIRTKLLGGTVPDVPISVNAQLPEDETKTLRERMQVTRQEYCWGCHQKMDELGLPFEQYGLFGEFRGEEVGRPVVTAGTVVAGLPELDGPVADPFELTRRLADSERVRQVFVRHAFRYWMGRNETLADSETLIRADKAYVDAGGSMKALLASLLTSDSFLYRRAPRMVADGSTAGETQ
ncbi:MAG: DUF1588 domain-containing protein [Acidobacteria bacterium]|nr:DUF1588 domain-containing protein [Acidobacteriota bacterium]